MRLKRLLCTVSGIGMWISGMSPLQGAGLLPEVCAFTSVVRQGTLRAVGHQQLSAMRHYSTGMFQGKYLQTDDQGSVSLRQSKYPKYSGVKGLILQPRIIRVETIENYDVLCHVLAEDLDGPYEGLPIRVMEDTTEAPFTIETPKSLVESPYAAFGRVEVEFASHTGQKLGSFWGTAAAIDRNVVVTAASTVLPSTIHGNPNTDRVKAAHLTFKHMFKDDRDHPNPQIINSPMVTMQCFIHPEWGKSFDPRYDVALIFLSESLDLSAEELESTRKRAREAKPESAITSQKIVYHLLDAAELGRLESVHALEDSKEGVQEKDAAVALKTPNSFVKLRADVLPFIEDSIAKHQAFLESMEALEALRAKERQDAEQALIDRGMAKGMAKGKIEIARNLKSMNLSVERIQAATGLTKEEIDAL
jgi:hypothetical protein